MSDACRKRGLIHAIKEMRYMQEQRSVIHAGQASVQNKVFDTCRNSTHADDGMQYANVVHACRSGYATCAGEEV